MSLAPHQQRVVEERDQLSERLTKLENFLSRPAPVNVALDEIDRLHRQLVVMQRYLAILNERIAAFETPLA